MIDWPENTKEIIEKMRTNNYSWVDIGKYFGTTGLTVKVKAKALGYKDNKVPPKHFTPEEDAILREAYINLEDMKITAKKLGRSFGVIRQRLYHNHNDLLHTRNGAVQRAINKYGKDTVLAFDQDLAIANDKFKKARIEAKTAARVAAIKAKESAINFAINLADKAIEQGKDRNEAIFELRAQGIRLSNIAEHFGITRERVRQIFDQMATKKAYQTVTNKTPDKEFLYDRVIKLEENHKDDESS